MTGQQKLEAIVARFGGMSPDEIAEFLCAHGCFGSHNCISCPLAVYLSELMQSRMGVGPYIMAGTITLRTPTNLTTFINRYDTYKRYPFLELP